MSSRRIERSGFTLIELLVVIAIIALLLSLSLPMLGSALGKGRQAACLSNLRQVHAAFMLYVSDNDGYMWNSYNAPDATGSRREWFSEEVIGSYLPGSLYDAYGGLLICPSARRAGEGWTISWVPPAPKLRASYMFNSHTIGWQYSVPSRIKLYGVKAPQRCILASEGAYNERPNWPANYWATTYCKPWHDGGNHTLFVDGHVTWYSLPEGLQDADLAYAYYAK